MKKYFFFIAILFPVMLHAQKNSQWRGENRNGMYNEAGLLKVWPEGGPQLLWAYEGLGEGYTSVAIANEKIYITGFDDDENIVLFVLDMTGKLLAKKPVCKDWTVNYVGPRNSVLVNEGKLYIYNSLGEIFCLDEEMLNEVWTKYLIKEYGARNIRFGMSENPLIVGDKIFATPGGEKHNMIALNKNTGALIWSSLGEGTPSTWCSPLYIGGYSVPMVVTATHEHLIAFNSDTGEMLWSHPQKNNVNVHPNIPVYSDGMIFSTTGYNGGSMLLRLKDAGKAVEQVWRNDEMDNQMGSAIRIDNCVYASGHRNNYWFCVDWKTGETRYKVANSGECNVISADGMLYVYSDKGDMKLVKPNPNEYEPVSSFKVTLGTGPHWAHTVIHNGVLYIRHGDALMAYKVK
jgi:outer membrane protein assembly factor BamB